MKKLLFFIPIVSCLLGIPAYADNYGSSKPSDLADNPATGQAKADYKAYLEKLKALSAQYKEITGEVKKVLKEEGVPTWDENEGGIKMVPYEDPPVGVIVGDQGAIKTNIQDNEKEIIVRFDMPGFKKEDIKLSLRNGHELLVDAARKNEMGAFNFRQAVQLPASADEKSTRGSYENGVLTVHLPKISPSSKDISVPIR